MSQPEMSQGCDDGAYMEFEFVYQTTGVNNPDYLVELNTGSYNPDNCMCEVSDMVITFEHVYSEEVITILDADDNTVEHEIVQDGDLTHVVILHPENLPDDNLSVQVDFESVPVTNTLPDLVTAGGLCIVENLGGLGGIPLGPVVGATKFRQVINGEVITQAFIPLSMTHPR